MLFSVQGIEFLLDLSFADDPVESYLVLCDPLFFFRGEGLFDLKELCFLAYCVRTSVQFFGKSASALVVGYVDVSPPLFPGVTISKKWQVIDELLTNWGTAPNQPPR